MRRLRCMIPILMILFAGGCAGAAALPTVSPADPATPAPTDTANPACKTHTAAMELTVSATEVEVGDVLVVTLVLRNEGCLALGLPQYRLFVEQREDGLVVDAPAPVVHSLAVPPGGSDQAVFELVAKAPGDLALSGSGSFEVPVGYPGPAYWGAAGTGETVPVLVGP